MAPLIILPAPLTTFPPRVQADMAMLDLFPDVPWLVAKRSLVEISVPLVLSVEGTAVREGLDLGKRTPWEVELLSLS